MTEQEAYQEHIRYTHDTYCRIVIRHASFDAARMLVARWKREISLEYLTEEKFVPLSTTDEYFQVPDRNGKIFYTSIASLSHISKAPLIVVIVSAPSSDFFNSNLPVFSALFINHKVNMKFQTVLCCRKWFFPVHQGSDTASNQFLLPLHCLF